MGGGFQADIVQQAQDQLGQYRRCGGRCIQGRKAPRGTRKSPSLRGLRSRGPRWGGHCSQWAEPPGLPWAGLPGLPRGSGGFPQAFQARVISLSSAARVGAPWPTNPPGIRISIPGIPSVRPISRLSFCFYGTTWPIILSCLPPGTGVKQGQTGGTRPNRIEIFLKNQGRK